MPFLLFVIPGLIFFAIGIKSGLKHKANATKR